MFSSSILENLSFFTSEDGVFLVFIRDNKQKNEYTVPSVSVSVLGVDQCRCVGVISDDQCQ